MNFKNKVCWVTGASSGIGLALFEQLNSAGAKVIISARRVEVLEKVKAACAHPENVLIVPLDLANSSDFKEKTKQVVTKFKRIDYLFNNAGISQRSILRNTGTEIDRRLMEVNFFGTTALTKAVLPFMVSQNNGHFIVISSIAGKIGFFERSAYSASKFALQGFFEVLQLEEAKHNIKVTMVCPGFVKTNVSINALNEKGEKSGEMDPNQAAGMLPDECASIILKGVAKNKREILMGRKEIFAINLKKFLPGLFFNVIKKQDPELK